MAKNVSDVVDNLVDTVYDYLQWKKLAALRKDDELPEGYYNYDHKELKYMVELIKPLLKTVTQTRKIDAENTGDIIRMLKTGKVTLTEAHSLMELVGKKEDLDGIDL